MKTIYLHRNKINNKVYIGQTIQDNLNHRWKNGKGYKTCTYFYNAILKYGWDNFEHIILEQSENWTQDELNNKEKEYIDLYKANDSTYGYNITDGGSTISSNASEKAVEWMKEHPEFGQARASLMLEWQKTHPDEILKIRRENIKKATEARKKESNAQRLEKFLKVLQKQRGRFLVLLKVKFVWYVVDSEKLAVDIIGNMLRRIYDTVY